MSALTAFECACPASGTVLERHNPSLFSVSIDRDNPSHQAADTAVVCLSSLSHLGCISALIATKSETLFGSLTV